MIILIGPSASGKTEIAKALISNFGFNKFVTTTTRSPRINEIDHIDYHFVTKDYFLNSIKNNHFIEYVNYNDNYYGTSLTEIDDNKVLIIEPKGLKAFNNLKNERLISFYIDADKEIRKARMIERKDDINEIKKRLTNDDLYFEKSKKEVNYVILNNNNNTSINDIANQIYNLYINHLKKI